MTDKDIKQKRLKVEELLRERRLHEAFTQLRHLSEGTMAWEITQEIDRAEQSYEYMLKYAIDGVEDPMRDEMYVDLISLLYAILDKALRHASTSETFTLYYNTLRYELARPLNEAATIGELLNKYIIKCQNTSIYNLITEQSGDKHDNADDSRVGQEELERRIFNKIWVSMPLSVADEEAITSAINDAVYPVYFREQLLSAVFLGQLAFFDERRLSILANAYQHDNARLSVRALVGLVFTLAIYPNRLTSKKLIDRIASFKEQETWTADVKMVLAEFMRSKDTERINRKMRDELIPQMMKLRPDIYKKINDSTGIIDLSSIEENPEWEDMLRESGITDRLKELSEMQEEGSDVFMSTFAQLKTYPFFSEISNWFLPFHLDHSLVVDALGSEINAIGTIIGNAPFLCDGDKYSFVLSLSAVPEAGRQMMVSQFEAQMRAVDEAGMSMAMLSQGDISRRNLINKYMQDLYRFFKLFRRKGEFTDPFKEIVSFFDTPLLADDLNDVETLTLAAEFYFKRKYYAEAFDVFGKIADKTPPSAQLFQKMGYCCQQEGNIETALTFYEQAELLNADSLWTLRRIAICLRQLDRPADALGYLERVAKMSPDDMNIALLLGHTLLELERYDEAVKQYYKVEFLDEKSTRAWRPLAWCLFLLRDFEQSRRYYDKIVADAPSAEDYLNMGHLSMAAGDYHEAVERYKMSLSADNGNVPHYLKSMVSDTKSLLIAGVELSNIPLIIDAVLYSYNKK